MEASKQNTEDKIYIYRLGTEDDFNCVIAVNDDFYHLMLQNNQVVQISKMMQRPEYNLESQQIVKDENLKKKCLKWYNVFRAHQKLQPKLWLIDAITLHSYDAS